MLAVLCGCQRQRSPLEGEWLVFDAKSGNPMPRINLLSDGGGIYWDGYTRMNLLWSVNEQTLSIRSKVEGQFSGWALAWNSTHSLLVDLNGDPIFIGGELVDRLEVIRGVWEDEFNSVEIKENGFSVWKTEGQIVGNPRVMPSSDGFVATMKFLDRQIQTRVRLEEPGPRLVWSNDTGRTNYLRRAGR
jgi:hypothetical protein